MVLTDLPVAIPLLQTNIALNQQQTTYNLNQTTDVKIELGIETILTEEIAETTATAAPLPPPPPSSSTVPTNSTVTAAVLSWGEKTDADNIMSQFPPGRWRHTLPSNLTLT